MKALLAPLAELADYEEIQEKQNKRKRNDTDLGLCKYSEDTFA